MNQRNEPYRQTPVESPEWIVRRARVDDLAGVRTIAEASAAAAQWTAQEYRSYCASHEHPLVLSKVILVAFDWIHEEIVGFAAFQAVLATGECGLENMAVVENWRRRGIGARLLAAGLLWCRGWRAAPGWLRDGTEPLESLSLEVRASNAAAIALYRQAGFVERGRRRGYYSQPDEDALQMSRPLGPRSNAER
ncbi:MAG TPA: GNAT family N-acetyltransferase [Acidobacteriaceae bacterium]|nr:GNAT family N-acetyltransferase [Acidobacteriaceae bacterium]